MVLQGARLACDLLLDMHEEAIIRLDEANYDAIIMIWLYKPDKIVRFSFSFFFFG